MDRPVRGGRCGSAAAALSAPAEQQPIERDIFLGRECDQEVGMRRGAVLVAVHVLLENAQISSELALRSIPSNFGESLG